MRSVKKEKKRKGKKKMCVFWFSLPKAMEIEVKQEEEKKKKKKQGCAYLCRVPLSTGRYVHIIPKVFSLFFFFFFSFLSTPLCVCVSLLSVPYLPYLTRSLGTVLYRYSSSYSSFYTLLLCAIVGGESRPALGIWLVFFARCACPCGRSDVFNE